MSIDPYDPGSSLFLEVAFDTLDQVRQLADLANEQGKTDLSIALMQTMKEIARSIDSADQPKPSDVAELPTSQLRA